MFAAAAIAAAALAVDAAAALDAAPALRIAAAAVDVQGPSAAELGLQLVKPARHAPRAADTLHPHPPTLTPASFDTTAEWCGAGMR